MTDAKQTRCPHCGSTFRITDAQLAAKGGSVRCGSCLQVFRAELHLVGAAAPQPQPQPAPLPHRPHQRRRRPRPPPSPGQGRGRRRVLGPGPDRREAGRSRRGRQGGDWQLPDASAAGDDFGFSDDDISAFIAKGGDAPTDEAAPGKTCSSTTSSPTSSTRSATALSPMTRTVIA